MVRRIAKNHLASQETNDKNKNTEKNDGLITRKRKSNANHANNSDHSDSQVRKSKRARIQQIPFQGQDSLKVLNVIQTTTKKGNKLSKVTNKTSTATVDKKKNTGKAAASAKGKKIQAKKLAKSKKKLVKDQKSKISSSKKIVTKAKNISQKAKNVKDSKRTVLSRSNSNSQNTTAKIVSPPAPALPSKKPNPKSKGKEKNKLVPKDSVSIYEKDPTFHSNEEIPKISTVADSRLIIRAVYLKDNNLLKDLTNKNKIKDICSFNTHRSICDTRDALHIAIEIKNFEAVKIIQEAQSKKDLELGPVPELLIGNESSGHGNYRSFGHQMAAVTTARGGKDGNNAFLKDTHHYQVDYVHLNNEFFDELTKWGNLSDFTNFFNISKSKESTWDDISDFWTESCGVISKAVRGGNANLARELIKKANEKQGFGFNFVHEEALANADSKTAIKIGNNSYYSKPVKSVSVIKKSGENDRITPLHCAAINPNKEYLEELLNINPDFGNMDRGNWSVIHYASVCKGSGPLKLLLMKGASATSANKEQNTPLFLATLNQRTENVEVILKHVLGHLNLDESDNLKEALNFLNAINKTQYTCFHIAAQLGYLDIMKLFIKYKFNPEACLSAKVDKLTPLMIACQFGHLNIVKYLVQNLNVNLETKDRRQRTALTHAVMNGQGHVVSFLLRYGADNLTKDSSGNSLVHYASAYGWYFILKLLYQAGCPYNDENTWKMTPLAISFMKGHLGIVNYILEQTDVDINSVIESDKGSTLLMQTCISKPTESTVKRVKFLADFPVSDFTKVDYEGHNALHYLVENDKDYIDKRRQYEKLLPNCSEWEKERQKESKEYLKYILEIAEILLEKNASPSQKNAKGETPFSSAVANGSFELAELFVEKSSDITLSDCVDSNKNTILHQILGHISKAYGMKFFKTIRKNKKFDPEFVSMVNMLNDQGMSPLHLIIKNISSQHSSDSEEYKKIVEMIKIMLNNFEPDVNLPIADSTKNRPLHLLAESELALDTQILDIVLKKKPEIDPMNEQQKTPLTIAIQKFSKPVIKKLIDAGANVNFKSVKDGNKSILLLEAERQNVSYELIPILIEKGANIFETDEKTGNNVLHYISKKCSIPYSLQCLNLLIKKGIDLNAINKNGRTAMHFAVNSRGGETDASYEFEEMLIDNGANLAIKDTRDRIPLHYIFIKIGQASAKYTKSSLDPVELVAMLSRSMKEKGQAGEFDTCKDSYGSLPIHYAALRGSTISASLLMTPNNINVLDQNGNSPFTLAILNKNESCALYLLQNGANYLGHLNVNIFGNKTAEDTSLNEVKVKIYKWKHNALIEREKEYKKIESKKFSILKEIVQNDWQGILHIILEDLRNTKGKIALAIDASLQTNRMKLAIKLLKRVKSEDELKDVRLGPLNQTLMHTLAKIEYCKEEKFAKILLEEKGLTLETLDSVEASPFVYLGINHNVALFNDFTKYYDISIKTVARMPKDKYGRTPLNVFFWDITQTLKQTGFENKVKNTIRLLMNANGNINTLVSYPIIKSPCPTVRFLRIEDLEILEKIPKFSPLILSIIVGNYTCVKWLLSMQEVDINFPDSEGKTPLMHAVLLNDVCMIKLLLNHSYEPNNDKYPWDFKMSQFDNKGKSIDFLSKDNKGFTVFHHLAAPFYPRKISYKNAEMILEALLARNKIGDINGQGKTPFDLASEIGFTSLANKFAKHKKSNPTIDEDIEMNGIVDFVDICPDFEKDSKEMTEKLIEEMKAQMTEEEEFNFLLKPNNKLLDEKNPEKFVLLYDEGIKRPFDVLLSFTDISYGSFGLYNFYKMQLVEERGKNLILLFTQWGRMGDQGQYQKTPFSTKEEAKAEFKKIFKSKSGNLWDNIGQFTPLPNKYRMVKLQNATLKMKQKANVKVDFNKLELSTKNHKTSKTDSFVLSLIKDLSLAHKQNTTISEGYYNNRNTFYEQQFSIGLIDDNGLQTAESILHNIEKLIEEKEKIKSDETKEKASIYSSIVELSEEFYTIMPVYGFKKEKLIPMFEKESVYQRLVQIYNLLHIEFGTKLLLGSQFNRTEMHPFEYVYKCLGTDISILDESCEETQLILEYIENSESNIKVEGIYKVKKQKNSFNAALGNRWLLWHGTNSKNILSILSKGLQIAPLGSNLHGHLFGKGIYFADTFSKSQSYCSGDKSFIFLCDVALGNVQPINLDTNLEANSSLKTNYHSLKTSNSRSIPDPGKIIMWNNRNVPIGKLIPNHKNDDKTDSYDSYELEYNEYVVFNDNQVSIEYIIQFKE